MDLAFWAALGLVVALFLLIWFFVAWHDRKKKKKGAEQE